MTVKTRLKTLGFLSGLALVAAMIAGLAIVLGAMSHVAAQAPEAEPMPEVFWEPEDEVLAWGLLMFHRGNVKFLYYYDHEQVIEACTEIGWTDHPEIGCFQPVDALHCDIILNDNLVMPWKVYATDGLLAMCALHWYGDRWSAE